MIVVIIGVVIISFLVSGCATTQAKIEPLTVGAPMPVIDMEKHKSMGMGGPWKYQKTGRWWVVKHFHDRVTNECSYNLFYGYCNNRPAEKPFFIYDTVNDVAFVISQVDGTIERVITNAGKINVRPFIPECPIKL